MHNVRTQTLYSIAPTILAAATAYPAIGSHVFFAAGLGLMLTVAILSRPTMKERYLRRHRPLAGPREGARLY